MEAINFTDAQLSLIERGCLEVWVIERRFLRWSLKRNIRRETNLVSRGVRADGIESVAHLIVAGPWLLLATVFGFFGVSVFALWGSTNALIGYLCIFIFAFEFLIGLARLLIAIRSKARYHLDQL